MEIYFADSKFQKLCQSERTLQKEHGPTRTRKILRHLERLRFAHNLADMRLVSGRCHELHGDRAGQLALDLDHPYRLIFRPYHEPIPTKVDGGLDWQQVTAILIIAVEDYH
jgi:toxin HigB-1